MEEGKVDRDDLHAAIEARKELGPELEPQLVDSFVARIEQRLERGRPGGVARPDRSRDGSFVLAVLSLIFAIPLTAIAVTQAGLLGLALVWVGIVLVNAVYNR